VGEDFWLETVVDELGAVADGIDWFGLDGVEDKLVCSIDFDAGSFFFLEVWWMD